MIKNWLFIVLCLTSNVALSDGSTWSLQALMQARATVQSEFADFKEEKNLTLLSKPLQATGLLHYKAPDYLLQQYRSPQPLNYEIQGDALQIRLPGKENQDVTLSDYPELEAYVAALRATLAGDIKTLRQHYQIKLEGHRDQWLLRLTPDGGNDEEDALVQEIYISGQAIQLTRVEIINSNGDRSITTIHPRSTPPAND